MHGICIGFVEDLCRICIIFVGFAFWVGSKRMGKQQNRRDSFPPTLPLYNIKGCNDVWLAIRITSLEFYKELLLRKETSRTLQSASPASVSASALPPPLSLDTVTASHSPLPLPPLSSFSPFPLSPFALFPFPPVPLSPLSSLSSVCLAPDAAEVRPPIPAPKISRCLSPARLAPMTHYLARSSPTALCAVFPRGAT